MEHLLFATTSDTHKLWKFSLSECSQSTGYLLLLSDERDDATVPSPCQVSPRSRSTWPRLLASRAGGTSPLLLCLGRTLFPLGEGGVGPRPGGSDGWGVARIDTREGAEVFEDLCHGAGRAFLAQVQQVTDPLCCQQLWRKTLDCIVLHRKGKCLSKYCTLKHTNITPLVYPVYQRILRHTSSKSNGILNYIELMLHGERYLLHTPETETCISFRV